MRKHLFFFALLIPVCFAFATPENDHCEAGCPPPTNLALTAHPGAAVSFDWDDCGCSGEHHVFYKVNGQAGPEYVTGNSEITISGLATGIYQFYFYTICNGESSSIIVTEVIM